jgi:hypothetical protein
MGCVSIRSFQDRFSHKLVVALLLPGLLIELLQMCQLLGDLAFERRMGVPRDSFGRP